MSRANPADSIPAIAPASAGRAGAPCRNPISAPASSGSDKTGMAVMQTRELLADQSRHHRQPLRHHHLAADRGDEDPGGQQQQPHPAAQQGFRPRQMQADGDARDRQRQRHHEFQVEERIMHRGHDVRANAQRHEEYRHRNRQCGEQRQRQQKADRPGAMARCRRQGFG